MMNSSTDASALQKEAIFYGYVVPPVACLVFPACFALSYYLLKNVLKSPRVRSCQSSPSTSAAETEFQCLKISDHVMSTVHAAVISFMGICTVTTTHAGDLIHDRSKFVRLFPFIITPYMLIDLVAMYWVARARGASLREFWRFRKSMIMHHLLLAAGVIPLSFALLGRGDFFVGCYMLTEIPMIFLNIYQALETIGLEFFPYQLLIALGALSNFGWFIFRVCIIPYMYWALARFYNKSIWATISAMPLSCHVANSIGHAFFLHWWFLIIKKTIESVVKFAEYNRKKLNDQHSNGHAATSSSKSYRVPHIEPTLSGVGDGNTSKKVA